MGREVAYMLVQYEQIKDKFPCATVLDDGRAVIPLAKADMLIGVSGIEIKGSHEVEALVASIGQNEESAETQENAEAEKSAEAEDSSQQEDNNEKEEEDES
ncbi:MAG: hypothetical protein K6A93_11110 [Bacteroidaceae bacterium]|nr:hypothetical protein [Bacteroidaceae bacterium]